MLVGEKATSFSFDAALAIMIDANTAIAILEDRNRRRFVCRIVAVLVDKFVEEDFKKVLLLLPLESCS